MASVLIWHVSCFQECSFIPIGQWWKTFYVILRFTWECRSHKLKWMVLENYEMMSGWGAGIFLSEDKCPHILLKMVDWNIWVSKVNIIHSFPSMYYTYRQNYDWNPENTQNWLVCDTTLCSKQNCSPIMIGNHVVSYMAKKLWIPALS